MRLVKFSFKEFIIEYGGRETTFEIYSVFWFVFWCTVVALAWNVGMWYNELAHELVLKECGLQAYQGGIAGLNLSNLSALAP